MGFLDEQTWSPGGNSLDENHEGGLDGGHGGEGSISFLAKGRVLCELGFPASLLCSGLLNYQGWKRRQNMRNQKGPYSPRRHHHEME